VHTATVYEFKLKFDLDLDLDSAHFHVDTLGHTPKPVLCVDSHCLFLFPGEANLCRSFLTGSPQFVPG